MASDTKQQRKTPASGPWQDLDFLKHYDKAKERATNLLNDALRGRLGRQAQLRAYSNRNAFYDQALYDYFCDEMFFFTKEHRDKATRYAQEVPELKVALFEEKRAKLGGQHLLNTSIGDDSVRMLNENLYEKLTNQHVFSEPLSITLTPSQIMKFKKEQGDLTYSSKKKEVYSSKNTESVFFSNPNDLSSIYEQEFFSQYSEQAGVPKFLGYAPNGYKKENLNNKGNNLADLIVPNSGAAQLSNKYITKERAQLVLDAVAHYHRTTGHAHGGFSKGKAWGLDNVYFNNDGSIGLAGTEWENVDNKYGYFPSPEQEINQLYIVFSEGLSIRGLHRPQTISESEAKKNLSVFKEKALQNYKNQQKSSRQVFIDMNGDLYLERAHSNNTSTTQVKEQNKNNEIDNKQESLESELIKRTAYENIEDEIEQQGNKEGVNNSKPPIDNVIHKENENYDLNALSLGTSSPDDVWYEDTDPYESDESYVPQDNTTMIKIPKQHAETSSERSPHEIRNVESGVYNERDSSTSDYSDGDIDEQAPEISDYGRGVLNKTTKSVRSLVRRTKNMGTEAGKKAAKKGAATLTSQLAGLLAKAGAVLAPVLPYVAAGVAIIAGLILLAIQIIITLVIWTMVFLVFVIFIVFIINSGAYVVPQTRSNFSSAPIDPSCASVQNPECPCGWPVLPYSDEGVLDVYQGSHTIDGTHDSIEAIDIIHLPEIQLEPGHPVTSRVSGIVKRVWSDPAVYGNAVEIQSMCGGVPIVLRYGHNTSVIVGSGSNVNMGQTIAYSGDSGMGSSHVHYEFANPTNPTMSVPYIPKTVPQQCNSYSGSPFNCNVQIP